MDLSRLPEPLRSKLEKQLAALPAEYRATLESKLAQLPTDKLEQVLSKTTPMLDRMAKKAAGKSGGGSVSRPTMGATGLPATPKREYDPSDHYNNTVGRGDMSTPPLLVLIVLVVSALTFLRLLGWFD